MGFSTYCIVDDMVLSVLVFCFFIVHIFCSHLTAGGLEWTD